MSKDLAVIVSAIIGGVLGIFVWKTSVYSADFGIGPLIFILICAWGGVYTFGPFLKK